MLILDKMDYTKHPYAKNIVRTSVMDYEPAVPLSYYVALAKEKKVEKTEKTSKKTKNKKVYDLSIDAV